MALQSKKRLPATVPTSAGRATLFFDSSDNQLKVKDEDGSVTRPGLTNPERTAITNLGSRKKVDVVNLITGNTTTHSLGSLLGLSAGSYFLEVRAYDASGGLVVGITATKTTADQVTYTVSNSISPFTGTIILEAIPN